MRNFAQKHKKLLAALLAVLAALALEGALFAARRAAQPDYPLLEVSADACGSWEFEPVDGGYYALAYNSYFTYTLPEPVPAAELRVFFSRSAADSTETVVYCAGVEDGVAGEFVYPLYAVGEGVYAADISMQQLTSLRIYPTEQVRSTVQFSGFAVNSAATRVRFSAAETLIFALLLGAALCAVSLYKNRGSNTAGMLWCTAWLGISGLLSGGALAASRMFTAASALGDLLPIAAAVLSSAAVLLLRFICSRKTLAAKAAILAAVLGLLFSVASLPLQVPDEGAHFLRCYTVSQGDLTFNAQYPFPDEINLFVYSFCGGGFNKDAGGIDVLRSYFAAAARGDTAEPTECYIQVLLPYLLPALGMAAADLLGAGPLAMLYAGRLLNVCMYAAATYFAVKTAKRYRYLVLLSAFWPLTAFVCGSLSYDALYMSAFLVMLGCALGGAESRRDVLLLCGSFWVMMSIKPTAAFLVALVWLCSGDAKRKLKLTALALGPGLALYAGTLLYAKLVAVGLGRAEVLAGVNSAAQVKYVLQNPLRYLAVLLVDGYQNCFYLDEAGLFGWLSVPTVLTPFIAPMGAVAVSALGSARAQKQGRRGDALAFTALGVLCYVITVTGFYCASSTLGSTSIQGVQARYLIPCLPALAALGSILGGKLGLGSDTLLQRDEEVSLWLCFGMGLLAGAELFVSIFLM